MKPSWAADALLATPLEPRDVAYTVTVAVGDTSLPLRNVVELHLESLDAALALDAPELLADHARWQPVRLRALHTAFDDGALNQAILTTLQDHLPDDAMREVRAIYDAADTLAADTRDVEASAVALPDGLARTYLLATLVGDREGAIQVVREAMANLDDAQIMLTILKPAQEELGRLWETGEVSVAHEHYTTAVTQLCLSLLYPRLVRNRTLLGRRLVATGVGDEAHEVGIRMISDLFEQGGWRTTFLGSDLPDKDIIEFALQQGADVLAVSATMAGHLTAVRRLITLLRYDPRADHIRVLVGGRLFNAYPRLSEVVGADGWAPSAREAFALCNSWTEDRRGSL